MAEVMKQISFGMHKQEKRMKHGIHNIVLCFVVLGIGSSTVSCSTTYCRTFRKSSDYWLSLDGATSVDVAVLAELMLPMVNEKGIKYLIQKMADQNVDEAQVAVISLVPIYETLVAAQSGEANAKAKRLLSLIETSSFFSTAKRFASESENAAIRDQLKAFLERSK